MAFPKLGSPTKRRSRGPALAVGQRYLALCHDDRRGLSLAERRGLTFARAASNAQCQQQRTHDSDESIHGAPQPVSVLMAGLSNRPVRSPTSAEKPHITTSSNRHSGPAQALQPQLKRRIACAVRKRPSTSTPVILAGSDRSKKGRIRTLTLSQRVKISVQRN